MKIELDAPALGKLEKKYLSKAIDTGFVSTFGPFVQEFEKKIADYLQVKGALAVQSGTAAIHMSLHESGIKTGEEVIVPALTFTASVNPVLYVNAKPVIVDVDPDTWNIDPVKIREAVTKRTKAIIPVHLYGNPCDMTAIMKIAREYDLKVIEDATESLCATFDGKQTGTFGDFGCFSFNGNKLITTGGGGMIVGNDPNKIEHMRYLANQAKDKERPGLHSEMGFNYRMTNIEAALGLAQFEHMPRFLKQKADFNHEYKDVLGALPGVSFQKRYPNAVESCWLTCVKISQKADVDVLIKRLNSVNIPARRIFMPLNRMPYLAGYAKDCPRAADIYHSGICLPSSALNKKKDIIKAALMIKRILNG